MALFTYLAVSGQLQERSTLANLLWDNATERQARSNLRYVLRTLRKYVGDYFFVSRHHVAFKPHTPYWSDEEAFSRNFISLLHEQSDPTLLQAVVDLYQDDFLAGFHIQSASVFDDWMISQRQIYRKHIVQALHILEKSYTIQGNYQAALATTRRLLQIEPWNEEGHREQMKLLAYTNQRSAALEQYRICRQIMLDEYGAEPQPETVTLHKQLQSGILPIPNLPETRNHTLDNANSHLSGQTLDSRDSFGDRSQSTTNHVFSTEVNWDAIPVFSRLYGREKELAQLEQWLSTPDNRVVAVSGMGGQGKTALVATLVTQLAEERPFTATLNSEASNFDRILWCSLKNISSVEQLLQFWLTYLPNANLSQNTTGETGSHSENNYLAILSGSDTPYLEKLFSDILVTLRQNRCLLVLDQTESILSPDDQDGPYRAGYEQFGQLLYRIGQGEHRSCLLLLGRTKLIEISRLERLTSAARHLFLRGISTEAGVQMLRKQGIQEEAWRLADIVDCYDGNPLALNLLIEMAHTHGNYNLAPFFRTAFQMNTAMQRQQISKCRKNFLEQNSRIEALLFDELKMMLAEQHSQLSLEKRKLLNWLAIARGEMSTQNLWKKLPRISPSATYLEAQRSLQHYTLLSWDRESGQLQLSNLILAYTTSHLIKTICQEVIQMAQAMKTAFANVIGQSEDIQNPRGIGHLFMQTWSSNIEELCYLDHYSLIDIDAPCTLQYEQRYFILEPIVHELMNRWGKSQTWYQLNHLLEFQTEIGLVTDHMQTNLRHLISCIEPAIIQPN